MSEKLRSEVDFNFEKGYFRDYSSIEPVQLYRFFEREINNSDRVESLINHNETLLLYCVSGEAMLSFDDRSLPFKSGHLVMMRTNGECRIELCDPNANVHYIGLTLSFFERVSPHSSVVELWRFFTDAALPLITDNAHELYRFLSTMIGEFSLSLRQTQALIRGALYQLLALSYRHFNRTDSLDPFSKTSLQAVGHTVYAIIRYIDEHLYSMDHLTNMAKDLGYSYNYLSHLFRKKTGITIQMYVSRKKIEKSTELLAQQQMSITEVASLLNYDCIQSFSKAFKRAMKMSPTEYRALHCSDETQL